MHRHHGGDRTVTGGHLHQSQRIRHVVRANTAQFLGHRHPKEAQFAHLSQGLRLDLLGFIPRRRAGGQHIAGKAARHILNHLLVFADHTHGGSFIGLGHWSWVEKQLISADIDANPCRSFASVLFYRHSFDATFMESPLSDLSSANSHGGDARQAIASPARNQLTPHVKWRYQPGDRNRLAVIMPGLLYHCDKPLFQALAQEFRQQGMGLLQCDFDYADDPDFMNAPKMNQLDQIYRDGKSIGDLVQRLGDFDEMFLVGKSLGAMAMAAALDSGNFDQARAIWVTPACKTVRLAIRSLLTPAGHWC